MERLDGMERVIERLMQRIEVIEQWAVQLKTLSSEAQRQTLGAGIGQAVPKRQEQPHTERHS